MHLRLHLFVSTASIEEGFDHKIPVIKITRQIGHLAYFSYEDSEGFQWIDPEKTKIFNYE